MNTYKKNVYPKDDFALLSCLPDSSNELLEKINTILGQSESWNARVIYVERESGEYRILISGMMKEFDVFPRN